MDALGWLIFLVALVVSVMLHETGHFVTAKRFGMKATQYFFGFGPTLWSFQRGETEYGVKAIPAGGFVKITGMTSLDEVDPEDEPRSFRRAPGWEEPRPPSTTALTRHAWRTSWREVSPSPALLTP